MKKKLLFIYAFLSASLAWAGAYDHSYQISEKAIIKTSIQVGGFSLLSTLDEVGELVRNQVIELLNFEQSSHSWGIAPERYQRVKHFKGWLRGWENPKCRNTRAIVLRRDSVTPDIEYSRDNCRVVKGEWEDPFSGMVLYDAQDIQIDHYVPLKNAYSSGAYEWSPAKRCLYANFLGSPFHLLAIRNIENSRKGDSGPEDYLPSNSAYQCKYIAQWLFLKMLWQLSLNPDEAEAIQQYVQELGCSRKSFSVPLKERERLRKAIADMQYICQS